MAACPGLPAGRGRFIVPAIRLPLEHIRMPPVSPLAPATVPTLPPIAGVRLGAMEAGIRYKNRHDLALWVLDEGTTVAGTLTKSLTAGAPVLWCKESLKSGRARAIVVNSGNSNAFTGKAGRETVEATAKKAAELVGCDLDEVFIASTGVIGEPIPADHIPAKLPVLYGQIGPDQWAHAGRAIMTTDTFPKFATVTAQIGGREVRINGVAKGSGMIAPDMATMLGFLCTDAAIPAPVLQELLSGIVERSFNAITVDSDTSTSDTVILCATGKAGNAAPLSAHAPALADFAAKLEALCLDLALQIVRDGEGASKFVEIAVSGAASDAAAKRIGLCIANSPLVKTAIAGEDANWGRIVMAVGKSGEQADRDLLQIHIGGTKITDQGKVVPGYDEGPVVQHMKGQEIRIAVDIGLGHGKATVYTCDLTHGYIDINGSYRS
jgi:glutamate N-acetyltransferase/amino-acid N-acetyltransferase